jgi:GR25 family glycosyltransferase involved in LPS biosynthesis
VNVDRCYVIHLPNPERRKVMEAQLAAHGMEATFLHADAPSFAPNNMRRNAVAEFGCSLSHLRCIVQAIEDRAKCPLFLEDDVVLADQFVPRLVQAMGELPEAWSVVYCGGHPREDVTQYSANLVKTRTFSFAEAYLLKDPAAFLRFWLNRIGKPQALYDLVLGEYAALGGGYCTYPLLTHQPAGWSQIGLKVDDKADLVRRAWQKHLR